MIYLRYLLLLFLLSFYCCGTSTKDEGGPGYLKDSLLSTPTGNPRSDSVSPFPWKYYSDGRWMPTEMDTLDQIYCAAVFRCFDAPLMYNYYFGYENYRFLWLRSFHRPVLITIRNEKGFTINTRILETWPEIWTEVYFHPDVHDTKIPMNHMVIMDQKTARKEYPDADSIILPRTDIKVVLDTTICLTETAWQAFKSRLTACRFWVLTPSEKTNALRFDGADWILEGQQQQQYHFVYRWCPVGDFADCCKYLIDLSAAKDEKVY